MKAKLNHIALLITDIKKAKQFYGDILGLQEVERPPFFIQGLWYSLGDFQLHLMLHEEANPPQQHPLCETVQPHFALSLTQPEIMIVLGKLKNSGITYIEEINELISERTQIFFYDFDKNMIELNNHMSLNGEIK
jgi:catechol 2,3-dioxygenase-like lactoylglutathione lyase family enzyme